MRRRFPSAAPVGQTPFTSALLVASANAGGDATGQLAGSVVEASLASSVPVTGTHGPALGSDQLSSSFHGPTSVISTFATPLLVACAFTIDTLQWVVVPVET